MGQIHRSEPDRLEHKLALYMCIGVYAPKEKQKDRKTERETDTERERERVRIRKTERNGGM